VKFFFEFYTTIRAAPNLCCQGKGRHCLGEQQAKVSPVFWATNKENLC